MEAKREITAQSRYIHLPVKNDAPKRRMRFSVSGQVVRAFEIELATGEPDFWVFSDVSAFRGQRLEIQVDDGDPTLLANITQSDAIPGDEVLYREKLRPQFHFSSRRGWNNDPHGLMVYRGEYHLLYQHNPYGWSWGNMHWGHALSTDLVHWEELGDALYPDHLGTMFTGSGVVDWQNTANFQDGDEKALICMYTTAGGTSAESQEQPFTQSIAYSNDRGRTWHKFEGNPVLGHIAGQNRDPQVIWYAPTKRWVMALYLEDNDYALFSSPDLKTWTRTCDITLPGATECPNFFPLQVDGDSEDTKWMFWGANGTYVLGSFDGTSFEQEGAIQRYDWGGSSYAAQTFSDIPAEDGRRIQMAWLRVNLPGMPFNQCMTFPCELTLRTTPEGVRLFSQPVKEIDLLHERTHTWEAWKLEAGETPLSEVSGELFDIRAVFSIGDAAEFGISVRGIPVSYDVEREELSCEGRTALLKPIDGEIRLQILVDRISIEIFGNDGRVALPIGVIPVEEKPSLKVFSRDGSTRISSLEVYELRSAWRV